MGTGTASLGLTRQPVGRTLIKGAFSDVPVIPGKSLLRTSPRRGFQNGETKMLKVLFKLKKGDNCSQKVGLVP